VKTSSLILALALAAPCLWSQETRGVILGRITDPSGAVMVAAEIRATNAETGVVATARTNEAGNYSLPYLLAGTYSVQVEMTGFKRIVRDNVQVRIRESVELNLQMQLGETTETVQVTAETPLLSTAEVSLGQVIDSRLIADLPSFGGSPLDLVHLAPGVMNSTDLRVRKTNQVGAASSFAVDGASAASNDFTIDGVPNTMKYYTNTSYVAFVPPQTSVSEFKVQTASFDAAIGHSMGALVNVSTKSGTNELHGVASYVMQNSALNAPTIFQNRAGTKVPVYQDHRYGISIGGPVLVPKAYDGRNRSFWFYAWEKNTFGTPQQFTSTVPTAAHRTGDLSALRNLGANYQVYDPFTTTPAAGGRFTRLPFAGNVIPASRLDPVALKMIQYWPLPNQPGTSEGRNNWINTNKSMFGNQTHLSRLDHTFSAAHRTYLRLNRDYYYQDQNHAFNNDIEGTIGKRWLYGAALDHVWVLSPSFFANIRYGITQMNFEDRRSSQGFDYSALGISKQFLDLIVHKDVAPFPNLSVAPFTTLSSMGWGIGDGTLTSQIHTSTVNVTKMKGDHTVTFGGEFRAYRENRNIIPYELAPQLSFASTYTRGPNDNSTAPPVGGELAAFLLGIPGGQMTKTASFAAQDVYYGLYVQDNFKVTPRLTLNLGLRWEMETPMTERYNRSVTQFAFDQSSPIEAQVRANYAAKPIPEIAAADFRVRGGLLFAGPGNRNLYKGAKNDFLPRVALAWQARRNTVLRAGYGIYYDTIGIANRQPIQTGYSQSTPIQASLDSGQTYIATLANPFPNGLMEPAGASGGLSTYLGQSVSFFGEQGKRSYAQRWSFGIQQVLPGQFLVETSYVGNRGTHLGFNRDLNVTPQRYLSTSTVRDQTTINYLSAQFPSPFSGVLPIYGQNMARSSLLRPYPQFGSVTVREEDGYSWYHSLQVRSEKRFSRGFTFQMAYTFSRNMDATELLNSSDPRPYEQLSTLDRPHRVVTSALWDLPFGRGRRFGPDMHKAANFFLGGWRMGWVMQRQSGPAIGWGDVWTLFTGDSTQVGLPKSERNVDRWFNIDAGFNRNSAQQLASHVRVSPTRFSNLRQDGQVRWDFSAVKSFQVHEKATAQFRAECINAWNHPNLRNANTTTTSSAFGTITAQDIPRVWQMSVRVTF
jgi:hypothetical protein